MIKKRLYKILMCMLVITLTIITQSSCGSNKDAFSKTDKTEFHLNTSCTISIYDMSTEDANKIIDKTFKECDAYERMLSRTIHDSDIWNINESKGSSVKVSDDTLNLIKKSINVSKATDGEFDITIGALSDLWNFTSENPKVPNPNDLNIALNTVGYENISINDDNTISVKNKTAHLDLGSIAKGYIADKLVDFMESKGVKSGILNLGGNIVTIGKKAGNNWKIGIEAPYTHQTEIIGSVEVADKTVVTSGVFERFFKENGKEYHHVIDPKTGYPKDTDVVLVSIMSDKGNSTTCDLYSTTCLLLGKEKSIQFMKDKKDYEYCILDTSGNITTSDGFKLRKKE